MHTLRRCLGWMAAGLLVALMLVTFVDVIGRYFFDRPVPGGHVLVQCLVCLLVFTGLPIAVLENDHIRVQLFDQRLGSRGRRLRNRFVGSLVAGVLLILAAQMAWQAHYFGENGEYFESIRIPLSWMAGYAAAASAIAALLAILRLFVNGGDEEPET